MKSYTDLEQSKKLAEILPLESADMIWVLLSNPYLPMIKAIAYKDFEKSKYYEILPAWSLAALLNILPVSCDDGQHCLALINHNPNERTEWLCAYEDDKGNLRIECYADNQIDACYEMILKLHKLKML